MRYVRGLWVWVWVCIIADCKAQTCMGTESCAFVSVDDLQIWEEPRVCVCVSSPVQVKPLAEPITSATIGIYRAVSKELLPTPSKSHYLFNTRDLAKIIQGMMQATKAYYTSKDEVLQLWCHETARIIADRM